MSLACSDLTLLVCGVGQHKWTSHKNYPTILPPHPQSSSVKGAPREHMTYESLFVPRMIYISTSKLKLGKSLPLLAPVL